MPNKPILIPKDQEHVILTRADYEALVAAAEEAEDRAAIAAYEDDLAAGRAEFFPHDMVLRLLEGANRVAEFRKWRGMTQRQLAEVAGLSQSAVSEIEVGKRDGSINTYARLARVLAVDIDDLAPKMDAVEDHEIEVPTAQLTRMGRGKKKRKGAIVQTLRGGKAAAKRTARKAAAKKEASIKGVRLARFDAELTRRKKV